MDPRNAAWDPLNFSGKRGREQGPSQKYYRRAKPPVSKSDRGERADGTGKGRHGTRDKPLASLDPRGERSERGRTIAGSSARGRQERWRLEAAEGGVGPQDIAQPVGTSGDIWRLNGTAYGKAYARSLSADSRGSALPMPATRSAISCSVGGSNSGPFLANHIPAPIHASNP